MGVNNRPKAKKKAPKTSPKPRKTRKASPKLPKLRILPLKAPVAGPSQSPARKAPTSSPEITPPPPLPPKVLAAAVVKYHNSKTRSDGIEREDDSEEDSESEMETLLNTKRAQPATVFSDGVEIDELEDEEDKEQDTPEGADNDEGSSEEEKAATESDSDDEYKLKFSVPFEGAVTSLFVSPTIEYKELVSQLADMISIPPKAFRVAYRFSTDIRSTPFSHLSNSDQLRELFTSARKAQATTKSRTEFVVEIKDLEEAAAKTKAKGKDKKRKRNVSDSEDSDDIDADKIKKKKTKSMPQWVAELEEANTCAEHPGHGCLKYETGHVQLGKTDLSTWAVFMSKGYPSKTEPPPRLQVGGDKIPAEAKATTVAAPPVTPTLPQMPGLPPQNLPMFGYPYAQWLYQMPPPAFTPVNKGHPAEVLSSLPEIVEDARLFLRLTSWLETLDSDQSHGSNKHDFAQFASDFERERYIRVVDLKGLVTEDLKRLIPEIAQGTAAKILAYAKADIKAIRKQERKRAPNRCLVYLIRSIIFIQ
ncbi:hypothetical protein C8F04DRAFT_1301928 [Mycena alexandri]|uniref:Uncharacterized protein n=1 Tax=Mycena alexandri TaxID=1745969 RepID=A0AAD6SFN1_9AGAR|nr:hypothetical protein C8F04DRAFT_1301928 [Mycena alexandri]